MVVAVVLVVEVFSVSLDKIKIAFVGADHVDIPVPRSGGLQGSRPRQASSASSTHSPGVADEVFTRVFRTFPQI